MCPRHLNAHILGSSSGRPLPSHSPACTSPGSSAPPSRPRTRVRRRRGRHPCPVFPLGFPPPLLPRPDSSRGPVGVGPVVCLPLPRPVLPGSALRFHGGSAVSTPLLLVFLFLPRLGVPGRVGEGPGPQVGDRLLPAGCCSCPSVFFGLSWASAPAGPRFLSAGGGVGFPGPPGSCVFLEGLLASGPAYR